MSAPSLDRPVHPRAAEENALLNAAPATAVLLHPRPQLTRDRWIDLCGQWDFAYDDDDRGLAEGWARRADVFDRTITVPFPPESAASGIGDPTYHPVVWERRVFTLDQEEPAERWLLHFGAVDYHATVWVNGQRAGEHQGGHTPFALDVTDALRDGGEQVIVVRAEDHPLDLAQPRGKQDWEAAPHRIWYKRTTGIWQPIWLEPVPALHIDEIRWTPDLDRGSLGMDLHLNAAAEGPLRARVRLFLRGELLTETTFSIARGVARGGLALDLDSLAINRDDLLWSPGHPNLIDADIELLAGDAVLDRVGSYAGLRSCGIAGGRFLLNGRPYYLRLVLGQNYWPESLLAAPSPEALRREVELIKELGFNGVRIHQKVEDPRFLAWCDRLGLLVWGEMANAYVFSPGAVDRLVREWLEVVERDYNHPSIIAWVPINESWGVPNLERDPAQRHYVRALYHLTKAIDETRPVIGNDGWEHVASDIWSIHDYTPSGEALRERYGSYDAVEQTLRRVQPASRRIALEGLERRDEPVMLTEFGGISYLPAVGESWWGYGTVRDEAEFLARYAALVDAILDSPVIAGFCYTQLTDTEQEVNGLLTADRVPKLDPAKIREITTRPSAAMPVDVLQRLQQAAESASAGGDSRNDSLE
jgi:beta-galactosidase/beta-glucuronidase